MLNLVELIVMSPNIDHPTKVKLLNRLLDNDISSSDQTALYQSMMTDLKKDFLKKIEVIQNNPDINAGDKIREIIFGDYLSPLLRGDKALASDYDKIAAKAKQILEEVLAWQV